MSNPAYFMNPHTGSVDTRDNWLAEFPQEQIDSLVQVQLADGSQVPTDFNPCQSNRLDWVEVE